MVMGIIELTTQIKQGKHMHIGVDFGTTYTKIAFCSEGRLEQFHYPSPPNAHPYVPTAVAYQVRNGRQVISIGEAARSDAINEEDVVFCENMKMLLPLKSEADWRHHGWNATCSPREVMRDYLHHLLRASDDSFERRIGQMGRIVVSVPELWQRQTNLGAETLRQILVDDLQLPVDHLQSEPVCAAAYYISQVKPDLTKPLHLLVCDMGGGTFDMVLCRVLQTTQGYKIQVLDFDGKGQLGLGSAGVAFDQQVVRIAYQKKGRKFDLHDSDVIADIRAFEKSKLENHEKVKESLQEKFAKYRNDPDFRDTRFYSWNRKEDSVTFEEVCTSFDPIRAGIEQVMKPLLARTQAQNWSIDRVALVGGFSQFPLVEETILECLGMRGSNDQPRALQQLTSDERFFAIARGAALIAQGSVQIEEYFPHTLELIIHRQRPNLHKIALPIVEAGQMLAGRVHPYYAQQDGRDVLVDVREQSYGNLPVQLRLMGKDEPMKLATSMTEFPPPGRYRVGLLVDRANIGTLVFDPVEDGEQRRYLLGEISPSLLLEES
ncbi:MAG: Hsp70 family protein [Candidatus Viridilinea halotolerans]|uniref:Hsp70 family protein n=1 Tax=Candidatus Viridilinea halotolerans TaxID=2491704 RepID=A0A426U1D8_9CHLR|nr:MAG: Hsp70 family protein [Candidatus Viridilinea halotolerans]